MATRNINLEAKAVSHGSHIQPAIADDHRSLTSMLDTIKFEYNSFQLQENKPVNVLLRGLPTGIQDPEIVADLRSNDLPIISTRRITKNGKPMPFVFVNL